MHSNLALEIFVAELDDGCAEEEYFQYVGNISRYVIISKYIYKKKH